MKKFSTLYAILQDTKQELKMAKITKEKIKGCVKGSALTIATLCGVIGGIVLGISLKEMKGKNILEFNVIRTFDFCSVI